MAAEVHVCPSGMEYSLHRARRFTLRMLTPTPHEQDFDSIDNLCTEMPGLWNGRPLLTARSAATAAPVQACLGRTSATPARSSLI
jgi:hypothetical protein